MRLRRRPLESSLPFRIVAVLLSLLFSSFIRIFVANCLHSTPLDPPPAPPLARRPRVRSRLCAPLTSSDSQLCEHGGGKGERGRERREGGNFCLLTVQVLSLSLPLSLARSLSRSKFDNFDLSHSYPSGARGEARRGTFSCGMLVYSCAVRGVGGKFIRRGEFAQEPIGHCRRRAAAVFRIWSICDHFAKTPISAVGTTANSAKPLPLRPSIYFQ